MNETALYQRVFLRPCCPCCWPSVAKAKRRISVRHGEKKPLVLRVRFQRFRKHYCQRLFSRPSTGKGKFPTAFAMLPNAVVKKFNVFNGYPMDTRRLEPFNRKVLAYIFAWEVTHGNLNNFVWKHTYPDKCSGLFSYNYMSSRTILISACSVYLTWRAVRFKIGHYVDHNL